MSQIRCKHTLVGMPAPYLLEEPFHLLRGAPPRMTPYPYQYTPPRKQRPAGRVQTVAVPQLEQENIYPQLWAAMLICWAIAMALIVGWA